MISHLITSKARRKLLRYFVFTPERTHLQDLVRKLDLDPKQVHRETIALWELDFLSYEIEKNKKYFTLNERHPFIRDLKTIFRKEEELLYSFSPVYSGPPLILEKRDLFEKFNFALQDIYSGLEVGSLFIKQTSNQLTLSLNYPDLISLKKKLASCLEEPHLLIRLQKVIQSCLSATSRGSNQLRTNDELLFHFLGAFITFHQLILAPHFSQESAVEVEEESRDDLTTFKDSVLSLLHNWPSGAFPNIELLVVDGSPTDYSKKLSHKAASIQYHQGKKTRGRTDQPQIEQFYVCQ